MPLLDHFRPPVSRLVKWHGMHQSWAAMIAGSLNDGRMPKGFRASPLVSWGAVEIDVGASRFVGAARAAGRGWAVPAPAASAVLEVTGEDSCEVVVTRDDGEGTVVAAVELVSPSNKDRDTERLAFGTKCARYLRNHVSVVVVDAVTIRDADLHEVLLESLGLDTERLCARPAPLFAASYRLVETSVPHRIETWPMPLEVGKPLPTLPLWLTPDLAVPLDLEGSYLATCKLLDLSL
jgi:hypothetical protein